MSATANANSILGKHSPKDPKRADFNRGASHFVLEFWVLRTKCFFPCGHSCEAVQCCLFNYRDKRKS